MQEALKLKKLYAIFLCFCFSLLIGIPCWGFNYYGAIGEQSLQERGQQQNLEERHLKNYSLGLGAEDWLSYGEFSSFKEATGSGSVTVDRNIEHRTLGGYIFSNPWKWIRPMVGGGIGYSVETIDSGISGVLSRDVSRPNYFIYGGLGLALQVPVLWLSLELRVYEFERAEPNPTAGVLWKIGLTL